MKPKAFWMLFALCLTVSLLLGGCAQAATTVAPAAQAPTDAPEPTERLAPTEPTAPTDLPEPTETPSATELPAATQVSEGLTFTDGLGRSITLAGPAQRVVSLAPSNTEILFAVGAGAQVVGRDEFSDYPAEAKDLPSIGGSFSKFNNEAIVDLQPDLVLASELNTPEQVQALEDLGLTVYYLANPKDMEGLYANLMTMGKLTGHEAEAEELSQALQARVQAVVEKTTGVTEKPTVFYELDSTDPNAPYTVGPGTFMDLLITLAGGQNAAASAESPWAQLSLEQIVVANPEIILLGDAAYGVTPESVGLRAGWEGLSAVKNGRVYAFDDNQASRPGPRLVDGLEALAKLLHPELFE